MKIIKSFFLPPFLLKSVCAVIAFFLMVTFAQYLTVLMTEDRVQPNDQIVSNIEVPFIADLDHNRIDHIVAGQPFLIRSRYKRLRICHYDMTTYAKNLDENTSYLMQIVDGWQNIGENDVYEYFNLPEDAHSGNYELVKKTVNHCGNDTFYTINWRINIFVKSNK